ncbi:hypothetical protein AAG570_014187 [Ranatra chinensis]|uniref:acetylornithine transaminase n=1 Tax=Ranatra chinensis TaxID=642074 RepID=A0ABD0Y5I8_9HEMI
MEPCLVSGKGCVATDADGKKYLDFASGIGVNSLGWCDEKWSAAVARQASTLQHVSNYYCTEPGTLLAQKLCLMSGMDKVFFGNSGAEANEGAIKAARKYSSLKYGGGRNTILTLENSFHGRTLAALKATGQPNFHQHFGPFPEGFKYAPANDIDIFKQSLTKDVCAVMLEVIQGEGGVNVLESAYLNQVREICTENDVLLIADEVQTGVGRTGYFLACEISGIKPDILTLAKGLGGGLPMGAVLLAENCSHALTAGDHGSTFGANPVCCAGALAVLDRLTPDFLINLREKGKSLAEKASTLPGVCDVSGEGLMIGLSLKKPLEASEVLKNAMDNGLLCLTAKDKLRLLPPLVISEQEIEKGLEILRKTLLDML